MSGTNPQVTRELILPGTRLDLPPRPTRQQVALLAERSPDAWTTSPDDLVLTQVVRLAVAALLAARLERRPGVAERNPLPSDPAEVTLAQLATLFRPHVDLTAQAFGLAVVEAVNAAVPAAVDPLRDGLRRVGVTGRDAVRVVALGLDTLPPRARQAFWDGVRTSDTVTAVVDAVASRTTGDQGRAHDVSGLDRSELARADALVLAGGRTTPITFAPAPGRGSSWVDVPLSVVRRERGAERGDRGGDRGGRGPESRGVEVALRGEGWVEVLEVALDAITAAMRRLDLGARPKGAGSRGLAGTLANRLADAGERTVADVCASLRDVEPTLLELFDHQVATTSVPVAVPVVDDELFVQLWLPTSALAGPLVTGSADLFLGGPSQVRGEAGRPGRGGERSERSERSGRGGRDGGRDGGREAGAGRGGRGRAEGSRPAGEPGADTPADGEQPARTGRKRRGGRGRGRGGAGEGAAEQGAETTTENTTETTTGSTTDPSYPTPAADAAPEPPAPDPAPEAPREPSTPDAPTAPPLS